MRVRSNGTPADGGCAVCQAPKIAEGCDGDAETHASALTATAQAMNENLAALTQQLAAQSAEMRAMRDVVARLQFDHQMAPRTGDVAPPGTIGRTGEL